MYNISVPVMNFTFERSGRENLVNELKDGTVWNQN